MNAPAYIDFLGSSPNGNKISGRFPGPDYPDSITIKGTSDSLPPRGNSGIWMSGNKYASLAITIVIKKAGLPDQEVSYDSNGMPKLSDAEASAFTPTVSGRDVVFSWTIEKEISVVIYPVDRKVAGGNYEEGVAADFPDDRAVPKEYPNPDSGSVISDTPPASGNYVYRLRARFDNGTFKTLAESGTVTL